MNGNYFLEIEKKVLKARNKYFTDKILFGLAVTLLLFCSTAIIISLTELIFNFNSIVRTILVIVSVFVLFGSMLRFILTPILQFKNIIPSLNLENIAELIGEKIPEVKDRLKNIIQISTQNENEFTLAAIKQVSEEIKKYNLNDAVRNLKLKKIYSLASAISVFTIIIFLIPQTGFSDAFKRISNYNIEFKKPMPFVFKITPGNFNIIRNEDVLLTAELLPQQNLNFTSIREIDLHLITEGTSAVTTIQLKNNSNNKFEYNAKNINSTFFYYYSYGEFKSDEYKILVLSRPIARKLNITITPPRYTQKHIEKLEENIGDVTALKGSNIFWEVEGDLNTEKVEIIFGENEKLNLKKLDDKFIGQRNIFQNNEYEIILTDKFKNKNENPIKYKITILSDELPTIDIIEPNRNLDLTSNLEFNAKLNIADDYGFSKLILAHKLIESKYEKPKDSFTEIEIPVSKNIISEEINYNWNLKKLSLVPEDVVEYYFELYDNDNVSGPKSIKSNSFLIRMPSFEEVIAKTENLNNASMKDLKEILKDADKLKDEIEELAKDLKKNILNDWQKERKLENIKEKFESIKENLKSAKDKISELTESLQKNSLLSGETMEKYFELQKLISEMEKSGMLEELKKLQAGMKEMSSEEIKKAMQNIEVSEEMIRTSIERTMSLLKRIQIEQKVHELVTRTEKMIDAQKELLNKGANENSEKLSEKQSEIKNDFNELKNKMDELEKSIDENDTHFPSEKLDSIQKFTKESEIENNLNESIESLKNKNLQKALSSQKKVERQMQKLSQQLNSLQEELFFNEMEETVSELQKGMKDLLTLSQAQENLKNKISSSEQVQQKFREHAEEQLSLQSDLNSIANDLMKLSQKSFVVTPQMGKAIGKAMNQMMQSIKSLEDRNSASAKLNQNSAMAALNEAANNISKSISDLAKQQQSGGSGGMSLMQQLKNMSSQQQRLNMKTEDLMKGENGLQKNGSEQLGRLSKEQEKIRKTLEELNREAEQNPDKNRMLGEINDLENLMKEVENSLSNNQNPTEAIEIQKKILSRMLEHQRSMQERDYEEKRISASGNENFEKSPSKIKTTLRKKSITIDLLKSENEGFSKDYKALIKKYYEELEKVLE